MMHTTYETVLFTVRKPIVCPTKGTAPPFVNVSSLSTNSANSQDVGGVRVVNVMEEVKAAQTLYKASRGRK